MINIHWGTIWKCFFGLSIRLEGELDPWLEQLWNVILERFPLPNGKSILPDNVLFVFSIILLIFERAPPKYRIVFGEASDLNIKFSPMYKY